MDAPFQNRAATRPDFGFDTGIRARDALDAKPTPLTVADPERATLYVCGPTVYDHSHLGHARSACAFDLIARHLRSKVGRLVHARNVTDVDDKILARAAARGVAWQNLAREMEASMREDFRALGCADPDAEPRATEHIPQMISHIQELAALGLAYADASGNVWQQAAGSASFGRVSGRRPEDLLAGARVAPHPGKREAADFALWKSAGATEAGWESPWGRGRPGWHIECSAMSRATLGDSLDVHGGGEDLKFPHHECECAQSEPVTGKPLARKWLHNGFVTRPAANGQSEEMHKSTGNAVNIKSLLSTHRGEAIRAWALGAHYRQPLLFSHAGVEHARERALRWAFAREAALAAGAGPGAPDAQLAAALDADFNTPIAFARLDAMASKLRDAPRQPELAAGFLGAMLHMGMGRASSLELGAAPPRAPLAEEAERVEELMAERERARLDKDWPRADELRDQISALGFEVLDSAAGSKARSGGSPS